MLLELIKFNFYCFNYFFTYIMDLFVHVFALQLDIAKGEISFYNFIFEVRYILCAMTLYFFIKNMMILNFTQFFEIFLFNYLRTLYIRVLYKYIYINQKYYTGAGITSGLNFETILFCFGQKVYIFFAISP